MPLTGLAELSLSCHSPVAVPAALGQLTGLRSLRLMDLGRPCVLQAGCFNSPNLLSLQFVRCNLVHAEALPGVSALQSLTRIEFLDGLGPRFLDRHLVQLPRLQHMVFETSVPLPGGACLWLSKMRPAGDPVMR